MFTNRKVAKVDKVMAIKRFFLKEVNLFVEIIIIKGMSTIPTKTAYMYGSLGNKISFRYCCTFNNENLNPDTSVIITMEDLWNSAPDKLPINKGTKVRSITRIDMVASEKIFLNVIFL